MSLWTSWHTKPPQGTPIDRTHPYVTNMVAAWIFNEGSGPPIELLSGIPASTSTAPGWTSSPYGPAFVTNGTSTAAIYQVAVPGTAALSVAGRTTIFTGSLASNYHANMFERGSSATGWGIGFTTSSVATNFTMGIGQGSSSAARAAITSTAFTAGQWFSWCFTDTGVTNANQVGYLNGVAQAAGGYGATAPAASSAEFLIGTYDDANYYVANNYDYLYVWNGVIPVKQIIDIYANPWQIFEPPLPFWWGQHAATITKPLFMRTPMTGLGTGGPFFPDPMSIN